MPDVFSVPIFLVTFREALETVIIVSVLLAFLKQTLDDDKALHKRLVRQVSHSLSYSGCLSSEVVKTSKGRETLTYAPFHPTGLVRHRPRPLHNPSHCRRPHRRLLHGRLQHLGGLGAALRGRLLADRVRHH